MQSNVSTFKSIVFACGIIGACQSMIWIALTVCAILTYRCLLRTPQYNTDHVIVTTIVKFYFEGDECKVDGYPPGYEDISEAKLTKPIEVFSWMIAFLVISSIQFIISLVLLKGRSGDSERTHLKEWCFITFIVLLMDAVLAGIFVRDYVSLKDYFEMNSKKDTEGIAAACAAMFIMAARGFALWIVNLGFLLYFTIFLTSTSHQQGFRGKGEVRESDASYGMDNRGFTGSSPSFVGGNGEGRDFASYDATREITFYPVTQQLRRFSVSSFEAVTRFNEEENERTEADNSRESKREGDKFECDCRKWLDKQDPLLQNQWRRNLYHSHGCPALRSELEQKLATIRGSEERVVNRTKKSTDFSHDLRNFKSGGGPAKAKATPTPQRGFIPEAPPIPAAATCNNSGFY